MKIRRLVVGFSFAALAAAALGVWLAGELGRSHQGFDEPLLVDYAVGARTQEFAAELERLGVVRSRLHFLAIRALRPSAVLMAGEYRFKQAASPWQVFDRLSRGDVHLRSLTIPEGLTRFEVAELVAEAGYGEREAFLRLTADPGPVRERFPQAQTLEGFLFPSTYHLPKTADGEQILELMLAGFFSAWEQASAAKTTELDPLKAVTMASLVEKETGVDSERGLVSGVYHNRLQRGMRLQCDPTIIYGLVLEGRYRGKIYKSDLEDPQPYNSYLHAGLPPGPIASAGRASLEAALRPAETDYLFFVAEAVGLPGHVFSRSGAEHSRAVARYRLSEQRAQ